MCEAVHVAVGGLQYEERPWGSPLTIIVYSGPVDTNDVEVVAHLLPCKHDLHNSCLKPWVERTNSCPICRAPFNQVELSQALGGPVISSYAVQNKIQEPEVDFSVTLGDELFAVGTWEPCLACGVLDDSHELMFCDGCNKAVHVFCAGFDNSPEVWYCSTCLVNLENDTGLPGVSPVTQGRHQRPGLPASRGARRRPDAVWARVWREVSRRLDLDLDFPFDEAPQRESQTDDQRREVTRWQRRLNVADQQGATSRLRSIANARLQTPEAAATPAPESQEELRAWNAFDKARESQDVPKSIRRSKRKTTSSPAPPPEPEETEKRQQKRPRLRRPRSSGPCRPATTPQTAAQHGNDNGTFLSSLLREVEAKPVSAGSPAASDQNNGQMSPRESSPAISSSPSGCATPVAPPVTAPLHRLTSPPLSGTVGPLGVISSPVAATYSPFSPASAVWEDDRVKRSRRCGRQRRRADSVPDSVGGRASSNSPQRNLSYSAKQEVQRMVKLALGSRYRDGEISKEQYTVINRDVSRSLYDLIQDASALADQAERERWQSVADEEVQMMVARLKPFAIRAGRAASLE